MKQTESAKTRIWKADAKTEQGIRHQKKGLKCQDYAEVRRENHKISMALVDGRGDTDVNAEAVKRIAKMLNEFMIAFFEEISQEDEATIAYNLMLQVERKIEELSKEYFVSSEELSSTLLAFCVDEKNERYCAVHLGDGAIALKNSGDKIQVLSMPTNGIASHQTILSTSEEAMRYVKVYRGSTKEIKGAMMVSDGIYGGREDWKKLEDCFACNTKDVILKREIDDQSIIKIEV